MAKHIPLSDILSWLKPLIAFDTRNGTGDEVACVAYLQKALAEFSPDKLIMERVSRSRGKTESAYVLAVWGVPKYLLNVHIDTVPDGAGWTGDPHVLRQKGDTYIGLGTSDIKGAAACILATLKHETPKDVAILFSGDEEHGSEIMPAVIKNGHTGGAPRAIVCEPTSCKVGQQHRGMLAYKARFWGPGGHSSLADHTPAPLYMASKLATMIGDYGVEHRDFGTAPYKGLCVNIGDISSDGAYNVIPTDVSLHVSMRPPSGDSVPARAKDIETIASQLTGDIEMQKLVQLEPFKSRDVDAFAPIFADMFDVVDLPFWTEAALLSEAGMNAVVFGPGDLDQAHTSDEHVTGQQLQRAAQVYARAVCGQF